MYEIGERVLYGIHGICTITGIERMRFGKERANYYVLEPKEQPGAKFYVSVANEAAVAKLRSLLSREELLELLHSEEVRNIPGSRTRASGSSDSGNSSIPATGPSSWA